MEEKIPPKKEFNMICLFKVRMRTEIQKYMKKSKAMGRLSVKLLKARYRKRFKCACQRIFHMKIMQFYIFYK